MAVTFNCLSAPGRRRVACCWPCSVQSSGAALPLFNTAISVPPAQNESACTLPHSAKRIWHLSSCLSRSHTCNPSSPPEAHTPASVGDIASAKIQPLWRSGSCLFRNFPERASQILTWESWLTLTSIVPSDVYPSPDIPASCPSRGQLGSRRASHRRLAQMSCMSNRAGQCAPSSRKRRALSQHQTP
eukprot:1236824-Rhodomonas_salina.1